MAVGAQGQPRGSTAQSDVTTSCLKLCLQRSVKTVHDERVNSTLFHSLLNDSEGWSSQDSVIPYREPFLLDTGVSKINTMHFTYTSTPGFFLQRDLKEDKVNKVSFPLRISPSSKENVCQNYYHNTK